jgi:hypothetical protein
MEEKDKTTKKESNRETVEKKTKKNERAKE